MRLLVAAAALLLPAAPAAAYVVQEKGGPQSATNGITLGPDGSFWVAEEFSGSVVRLSPSGVVLGRYVVGDRPSTVVTGPGGRVWVAVTGASKLVWFDATAAAPTPHDVATPPGCPPVALVAGGDGRMYFSLPSDGACNGGASRLGSVADTGVGPSTAAAAGGGTVYDLAVAQGKLFAPDFDGGVIRRIGLGPALGVESVITLPTAGAGPDGVTADAAGVVWVTEWNTGKLARFPAGQDGGSAQELSPAGLVNPFGIVAGADGRIYVTGKGSANVVRVAGDGSAAAYAVPDSEPFRIVNGTDGDLWFTDQKKTRILRLVNAAPRSSTGSARPTAPTTAAAQAAVDPRGNPTRVAFDYGPTTAYGASTPPVEIPAGAEPSPVTGVLSGLTPNTTYHVRVRALNDEGSSTGGDVVFTTPPGLVDADADGASPPSDCNDADPAIRPGAPDAPGDRIDQDCSGADSRYPELTATTNFATVSTATTVVRIIEVSRLRGGETITVRCRGRRCPFATRTYKDVKRGKRTLGRALLKGRALKPGTTITVRVTAPRTIGTLTVLTVRKGTRPRVTRSCLAPGASRGSPCR